MAQQDLDQAFLDRHNYWREQVKVPPLKYSEALEQTARKWGKQLAREGCAFYHSDTKNGENLWMGTKGYFSPEEMVDGWASERLDYNLKRNECDPGKVCGHYTQMIWKTTESVGCALVDCDKEQVLVCHYDPPGNYVGIHPLEGVPQKKPSEGINKQLLSKTVVQRHNYWREEVNVSPLQWSSELASQAQQWADQLARKGCGLKNSKSDYGENLFMGTSGYFTAKDIIDSWAKEKKHFNLNSNECETGKVCGHYTQLIWAKTESVGCGVASCDGNDILVCFYDPPGNWVGESPLDR
jgi:pathogenesis-related protein 1